jgi:hypothetical protein
LLRPPCSTEVTPVTRVAALALSDLVKAKKTQRDKD